MAMVPTQDRYGRRSFSPAASILPGQYAEAADDAATGGKRPAAPPIVPASASSGRPSMLASIAQAQDIAQGVVFLASPASNYITGTELIVDGGMTGEPVRRG